MPWLLLALVAGAVALSKRTVRTMIKAGEHARVRLTTSAQTPGDRELVERWLHERGLFGAALNNLRVDSTGGIEAELTATKDTSLGVRDFERLAIPGGGSYVVSLRAVEPYT